MKQFARKQAPLSLVTTAPEPSRPPKTSSSLNEFFDGWLTSVSSTFAQPTRPIPNSLQGNYRSASTDVMRVNRATVRESREHRHWPPEVVQTFMRADVIKRKVSSEPVAVASDVSVRSVSSIVSDLQNNRIDGSTRN